MSGSDRTIPRNGTPKWSREKAGNDAAVERIAAATAHLFGCSVNDLTGYSRQLPLVRARRVAMVAAREATSATMQAIGRGLNRDHSTVSVAIAATEFSRRNDDPLQLQIADVKVLAASAQVFAAPVKPVTAPRVSPPRVCRSMRVKVDRLRAMGWSDKSIARNLDLPLLTVRQALGLPTYTRDGVEIIAPVEVRR